MFHRVLADSAFPAQQIPHNLVLFTYYFRFDCVSLADSQLLSGRRPTLNLESI